MKSLRSRLLASHVGLVAVILVAFSTALYLVVRWRLTAEIDGQLLGRLKYIESRVRLDDGDEVEFQFHADEYPEDLFWRVSMASGAVLGRSTAFPGFEPRLPPDSDPRSTAVWSTSSTDGEPLRLAMRTSPVGHRPQRFEVEWTEETREAVVEEKPAKPAAKEYDVTVAVARSLRPRDRALGSLVALLGVAVPVALLVSVVGSLRLVRRVLSPVAALASAAERIGPRRLGERVASRYPRDELGRLVDVINGMLDRIEEGFKRERRFTSDASHELRTPLTALRGEIEVALRRDRTREEYAAVLQGALEDVGRLERVVSGLLLLARSDAGRLETEVDEVAIGEVIRHALDPDGGQDGRVELVMPPGASEARVRGDRGLLETVIRNLLDNALHHGAPPIRVTARAESRRVSLAVSDSGTGFPPDALPRIFERFFRADPARSRKTGGTGLGLAIAHAIVDAHGGSIQAANLPTGGACITIELPRACEEDRTAEEGSEGRHPDARLAARSG
ncbi:MAG: HAMP domain-containing protein [Planctomycetes bacterium]|nr:HAMP domain-containing protein [Planctomycetota bacterium]